MSESCKVGRSRDAGNTGAMDDNSQLSVICCDISAKNLAKPQRLPAPTAEPNLREPLHETDTYFTISVRVDETHESKKFRRTNCKKSATRVCRSDAILAATFVAQPRTEPDLALVAYGLPTTSQLLVLLLKTAYFCQLQGLEKIGPCSLNC